MVYVVYSRPRLTVDPQHPHARGVRTRPPASVDLIRNMYRSMYLSCVRSHHVFVVFASLGRGQSMNKRVHRRAAESACLSPQRRQQFTPQLKQVLCRPYISHAVGHPPYHLSCVRVPGVRSIRLAQSVHSLESTMCTTQQQIDYWPTYPLY